MSFRAQVEGVIQIVAHTDSLSKTIGRMQSTGIGAGGLTGVRKNLWKKLADLSNKRLDGRGPRERYPK